MKTLILGLVIASLAFSFFAVAEEEKIPAFPGAEGFGAYTPGGRGGKVFLVTNLNNSGSGSLRAAIEAKEPRIVVFRVSGIIELDSKLMIRNPYITIAGQTAPGDGICLKNYHLGITTHDVVVRYLRCRPGDVKQKEMDSLSISDGQNIIIDHCSASWSIDETLSVNGEPAKNITVQWCMITESLNESYHHKGAHGYGSLICSSEGGITFHHNIYAHHRSRNPRPGGKEDQPGPILDFRNNLIYNWGSTAGYTSDSRVRINYVGNYLKAGPSTKESKRGWAFHPGSPKTLIFVADNFIVGFPERNRDNWLMIDNRRKGTRVETVFPAAPVTTDRAEAAYEKILENAGATLPTRDAVNLRIIEEIKTGKGKIIDSQDEVGGWADYKQAQAPVDTDLDGMPDEWEKKYGLDLSDASDNSVDSDGDGYTNIEEFINDTEPFFNRAD